MVFNKEKFVRNLSIILCVGNLLAYVLFHISYLMFGTAFGEIFEYVRTYATMAWEFLIPPAIALIELILYAYFGTKSALVSGILLSLSRLCYCLLFYYMKNIASGYDSIESILISVLQSSLMCVLTFAHASAIFGLGLLIINAKRKKADRGISLKEYSEGEIVSSSMFDTTKPITLMIIGFAVVQLVYYFIYEIIDTVMFFIKYGSSYSVSEILMIAFSYLFILILCVLSYFVIFAMKNKIINKRLTIDNGL